LRLTEKEKEIRNKRELNVWSREKHYQRPEVSETMKRSETRTSTKKVVKDGEYSKMELATFLHAHLWSEAHTTLTEALDFEPGQTCQCFVWQHIRKEERDMAA
jgi:hypothetical protein